MNNINKDYLKRAQGCFLGQLSGDALGSLVEFQTPEQIKTEYPNGVRVMTDGGTFNTIAGQPTDDSEMALLLARSIIKNNKYDSRAALETYKYWISTGPFDCGLTISNALRGQLSYESQANGAMMRISPLGIFGSNYNLDQVAEWAIQDSMLTHPHPVCFQANSIYTMAIAHAIKTGVSTNELYQKILEWAKVRNVEKSLMNVIVKAKTRLPKDFTNHPASNRSLPGIVSFKRFPGKRGMTVVPQCVDGMSEHGFPAAMRTCGTNSSSSVPTTIIWGFARARFIREPTTTHRESPWSWRSHAR